MNRDVLVNRFLTYHKNFKKFDGMTEEQLNSIKEEIKYLRDGFDGYDRYWKVLQYYIHPLRRNFDETVAGLILACDPFLESLEIYEQLGKPAKDDTVAMEEYANQVRNAIGFYDRNLRIFEKCYRTHLQKIEIQKAFEEVQGKKKALKNSEK